MSIDEAIEILSDIRAEYNIFGEEREATRYHALSWGIKAIKAETVDAVPVRHGMWIYHESIDVFECSVCGRQMVRNIFDFCPWCGARMEDG